MRRYVLLYFFEEIYLFINYCWYQLDKQSWWLADWIEAPVVVYVELFSKIADVISIAELLKQTF